jgi:hypothetical protein
LLHEPRSCEGDTILAKPEIGHQGEKVVSGVKVIEEEREGVDIFKFDKPYNDKVVALEKRICLI